MSNSYLDFKNDLRLVTDYIFSTRLCRKAVELSLPGGTTNIIRDLLKAIDTLALSCHLPEFTDHALSHIVSLIERASEWTLANRTFLIDQLNPPEAALLLLGLLIHDMGMLSQDPLDLEEDYSIKGMSNVAIWVRRTHCARLPHLLRRVLESFGYEEFIESEFFALTCYVAMAHEEWAWHSKAKHYPKIKKLAPNINVSSDFAFQSDRACGIAAIIGVCDLLDEDIQRCDTDTLLLHRQGVTINKAHWIRHLLTQKRVEIQKNSFTVSIGWLQYKENPRGEKLTDDPSGCQDEDRRKQVINALKNQFSSALLYNDDLRALNAALSGPNYQESGELIFIPWNLPSLRDFWGCTPERILQSVFSFARDPEKEVLEKWNTLADSAPFIKLDLAHYHRVFGISGEIDPYLDEEISFKSILETNL